MSEIVEGQRTIIESQFTDQPECKRYWWFLNEGGHCELCLNRPDREADLYVAVSLRDMMLVVRGDRSLSAALAASRIDVHGSARAHTDDRLPLEHGLCADDRPERERSLLKKSGLRKSVGAPFVGANPPGSG